MCANKFLSLLLVKILFKFRFIGKIITECKINWCESLKIVVTIVHPQFPPYNIYCPLLSLKIPHTLHIHISHPSRFTLYIPYLFFDLHFLPLFPSTYIYIYIPFINHTTFVFSLLKTCLSHLNLFYFFYYWSHSLLFLIYLFLILSSLVTLMIHFSIVISDTLILYSIFLPKGQHSDPYVISGLTKF